MSSNVQKLGDALSDRMKATSQNTIPIVLELGLVNGDLSVSVDSLPNPIPQTDYMIALHRTHETYYTYNELYNSEMVPSRSPHKHIDSGHQHTKDGLHDHRVSSVFRRIEPGDRVLVAWVGHEPLVVEIFVAGTTITPN